MKGAPPPSPFPHHGPCSSKLSPERASGSSPCCGSSYWGHPGDVSHSAPLPHMPRLPHLPLLGPGLCGSLPAAGRTTEVRRQRPELCYNTSSLPEWGSQGFPRPVSPPPSTESFPYSRPSSGSLAPVVSPACSASPPGSPSPASASTSSQLRPGLWPQEAASSSPVDCARDQLSAFAQTVPSA